MKKLSFVILAMLSIGCDIKYPDHPKVVAYNKQVLSNNGDEIGTLPDGRKVIRYEISRGDYHSHTIYVVSDTMTVTTNRLERNGKTSFNRTESVIIDGVKYLPEKKETE